MSDDYTIEEELKYKNFKPYWKYTVFYKKNEFVGSVVLLQKKYGLTLYDLHIAESHRRKGLAKALVNKVIEKQGSNDLFVRATPYNDQPMPKDKLVEFYENLGFTEFGNEGRMVRLTDSYREDD
jgi:GNAT superfamily N-acetyltransferase